MYKAAALMMVALLVGSAPRAEAQQRDALAQRALIDSLLPELAAARREMQRVDSIARAVEVKELHGPLDSGVVRPFTIITPREKARETFTLILNAVARQPELFSALPPDPRLVIGVEWQSSPHRGLQAFARERHLRMAALYGSSRTARARSADAAVAGALYPLMSDSIRSWLQDRDWARGLETDRIHRHLATSPSPHAQSCFRYDTAACARTLGLAPVDSLQGYTPEQIRQLAARRIERHENTVFWHSCVEAKNPESCLIFLERTGGLPAALPPFGRATFLMYVLERGGSGAFARLIAPQHTSAAEAIVAAGNAPLPLLIDGWRRHIEANREQTYAGLSKSAVAVLLWTAIAALLAMRSTRRRAE